MISPVDKALKTMTIKNIRTDFQIKYNELKEETAYLEHYFRETERVLCEESKTEMLLKRYNDLKEKIKKNKKELRKIIKYYNANL